MRQHWTRSKLATLTLAGAGFALTGCTLVEDEPTTGSDGAGTAVEGDHGAATEAVGDAGQATTGPGAEGAADASAHDTTAQVLDSGVLRVCSTGDYRPYTYLDPQTQEWSGIDVTMAQDLAAELGVEVEMVRTTWGDLIPDLEAKCDIAAGGISFNTERAQQVFFTQPTVKDGKAPITRCDDVETYQSIEDINAEGVRVITPVGGTNEKFADEHFPKAEIIKWDNNNTIFEQIVKGEADVMVTDASETKWVAHTEQELCAVHPDEPFTFFQNGYLLPHGDVAWQQLVDVWLDIALQDGTYQAAEEPWFG